MVYHNSKTYYDSEPIDWEIAIEAGAYFRRAQHLGLPKPPACLVFCSENLDDISSEQVLIMADYHKLYEAANSVTAVSPNPHHQYTNHVPPRDA